MEFTNANNGGFLRLPKEIRLHVYDLLLSSHIIHIAGRIDPDLLEYQRRTMAQQGYLTPLVRSDYTKVFHTLCTNGPIEDEAYKLSKLPNVETSERQTQHARADLILRSYFCRHKPCLDFISDYQSNDFDRSVLSSPCDLDCRVFRERGRKCTHFLKLLKSHGQPCSGGLRALHADTRLDLTLLLTCRQIYSEAKLIPYTSNTFDFADLDVLWKFASQISTSQCAAISKIQLSYWTVGMLQEATKTLTGLRQVVIDHSHPQSPECAYDRLAYLNYTVGQKGVRKEVVETARVFWSRSRAKEEGWSGEDLHRGDRRRDAEVVERALMGKEE